ncbi:MULTISPECIES: cation-transporting P-type ATPase [unclassified Streptomyces]|uniref:cation-translocating P-type ATPase n=1 Tax=unclassified Streptomyces TaxID=2593676 RepID=UPI0003623055|nr:cation-transporting P-type ATPase [Streptomyces sp. 303MFCol5.2]
MMRTGEDPSVAGGGEDRTSGSTSGTGPSPAPIPQLTAGDVFSTLTTSRRGLSAAQARARLERYGTNELPRVRRRSAWRQLGTQFTDLFAVVLIVAACVTFLAYRLQEPRDVATLQLSVAILGVVVLNAIIGFAQEYSAEQTAQALEAMVPHTCRVLRGGERLEVPARELAPGDVVVLEAGDAVPADCRVVEAHELTANNAPLTGESNAVVRTADPVAAASSLEARNCVFMGTDVVAGSGRAVVYATGATTEFGRIYRLAAAAPKQKTPLQHQVASMARRVAGAALAIGALMFAVRLPTGESLVPAFVFALGVMVAMVPEGLPATLSVSLAIGVRRMARHHALIKQLLAVEALGSTTVVCTDKTGTLTQAEMTVTQVWAGRTHAVSGVGYAPNGVVSEPAAVRELLRVAGLCCNARLVPPGGPGGRQHWRVLGDTTEGALLVVAAKAGLDPGVEEETAPRVTEFPFDSTRKLMTTVHKHGTGHQACVKGAPVELLARCTGLEWDGRRQPLTEQDRAAVVATSDAMASQGLRVLAVARRGLAGPRPVQDEAESGLTLLGLVGMLDPPRPEVTDAVAACRRAGIRIVMVTGDHPLTGEAVARRVGIVRGPHPVVVSGARLDAMDDEALDALLAEPSSELLLCRVGPEHKMRVVTAFQRRGEVVAVTGDGANDAPALKHADIGVAMGASGTDVAREAASMVLLDDSFASIATAVRLGRTVYRNIRKFLVYLFSHNIGELVPILAATFAGFPLVPISAVQILAIDLGSDVLPALALGAEPPEPDVMERPPRSRQERLFSAGVVGRILFLGGIQAACVTAVFFWHIGSSGIPFDDFTKDTPVYREAITMVQAGIVLSQFFNALAVRTERQSILKAGLLSNPALLAAGGFGIALMAAISYVPPLQDVFNTAPLEAADWAVLAGLGTLPLIADEVRKWWLRRRTDPRKGVSR